MLVSCTVLVLPGRGLCDGPILIQRSPTDCGVCLSVDQVKVNNLDTYCEQVGRRGKDCEKKR
jgi:hypothetical protein